MSANHPKGLQFRLTIIRADGTYWVKEPIKHLITKKTGWIVTYEGEHGQGRVQTWFPREIVDHFTLEELDGGDHEAA